jgi:two-component system sensor histidine kinase ChiS
MSTIRPKLSLLVAASCLGLAGCARTSPTPVAHGGVLDLRSVDFSERVVDLDGPWNLDAGIREPGGSDSTKVTDSVTLPAFWKHAIPARSATLRLEVLLPARAPDDLVLATNQEISAYVLWVDGKPLFRRGVPSESASGERFGVGWREANLPAGTGTWRLVLQVSNFEHGHQGHIKPIQLGTRTAVRKAQAWRVLPYLASLGVLLAFGMHYLLLLWPLIRDRQYLFFGVFCITRFASGVVSNVDVPFAGFLGFDLPDPLRLAVGWLGIALSIWSVGAFAESLFPDTFQRWFNRVQLVAAAAASVWFVFAPFRMWSIAATLVVMLGFLQVAFLCRLVVLALVRRQTSALTFAIGYFALFVLSVHAALYLMGFVHGHIFLTEGSVAMAFAEATALSQRISRTLREKRRLLEEVQEQNRDLERLGRVKDDFLANTSHELRTPLHAIQGLTQAVLADARNSLDAGARRSLDLVRGNARRLAVLVGDLLEAARLDHQEIVLRRSKVDLPRLVGEILDGFRLQAAAKGVSLAVEAEESLPATEADPDRIVQVIVNLVTNSLRFTDAGSVTVRLRQAGERIQVEVVDTGTGIAPADRERIFERFEQADRRRGGTGLGLSISRDLVRLHGGDLTVESDPGTGSRFRFDLPIAMQTDPISPDDGVSDLESLLPSEGKSGLKVLAVDDEPTNLRIVQAFLEPLGIGVVPFLDGEEIEDRIEEHCPDLVLLDVMLPGEDGFELCRRIRGRWGADELPVLFLSARTAPEDVEQGFACGGNDYVPKPFLREELLARVGALLKQRQAVRQLDEEDLRARMCRLLERALEVWSDATGQGKADLAEASGLWKVQMDRNGWRRTATLDRYLEVAKLPKVPKWRPVLRTIRFVSARPEVGEAGAGLLAEADLLETMLGRGGD